MTIKLANQEIQAWNELAEYACQQAARIEQIAWESFEDHAGMEGMRPIAAAQLTRPDLDAPWQDSQPPLPTETAPKATEPAEGGEAAVSVEQVRSVLAELSASGHTAQARALIEQTGAARLSEVDPSKFGWLLAQAMEARDAS